MNKYIEDIIDYINVEYINDDFAMTSGNNGPYYDPETPVRNVAHWIVSFSELFLQTKETKYLDKVNYLSDLLINSDLCSENYIYKCREKDGKDVVNGTIGPAWIIEGLISAYDATGKSKCLEHAAKMFNALKYDWAYHLWHRADLDGTVMSIDATFNHQLWFAMAGSLIVSRSNDSGIEKEIIDFLDKLTRNLKIYPNGLIHHNTNSDKYRVNSNAVLLARTLFDELKAILHVPSMKYKEQGYHVFNVYAMAKIYANGFSDHCFFKSDKFQKILGYAFSDDLYNSLNTCDRKLDSTHIKSRIKEGFNVFSYAYNSPAFELPYINSVFCMKQDCLCDKYLEKQFQYTFVDAKAGFAKNTDDKNTLNARLYELIYKNPHFQYSNPE